MGLALKVGLVPAGNRKKRSRTASRLRTPGSSYHRMTSNEFELRYPIFWRVGRKIQGFPRAGPWLLRTRIWDSSLKRPLTGPRRRKNGVNRSWPHRCQGTNSSRRRPYRPRNRRRVSEPMNIPVSLVLYSVPTRHHLRRWGYPPPLNRKRELQVGTLWDLRGVNHLLFPDQRRGFEQARSFCVLEPSPREKRGLVDRVLQAKSHATRDESGTHGYH